MVSSRLHVHNLPLFKPSCHPREPVKPLLGSISSFALWPHPYCADFSSLVGTTWNSVLLLFCFPPLKLLRTGSSSWNAFSPPHLPVPTSPGSLQGSPSFNSEREPSPHSRKVLIIPEELSPTPSCLRHLDCMFWLTVPVDCAKKSWLCRSIK